ncbi:hypothetical protein AAHA92_06709 [Salvia divinorum]|uniref:Reverse transcriptase domain-containing protein n=1 Tax=Salvia divinorum TaxID=28513 RepID=A0ABD1I7B7_SALDI
MTTFYSGVGRTEAIVTTTLSSFVTDTVVSQLPETPPLDPIKTMFEHLVASMARFESRMDDFERRPASTRPSIRPKPNPPYGLFSGRSVDVTIPYAPPASAVTISVPPLTSGSMHLGFQDGYRQTMTIPLGFGYQQPQPRALLSRAPSSWELPQHARQLSTWETTGYRPSMETQFQGLGSAQFSAWGTAGQLPNLESQLQRMGTAWDNPSWHSQTLGHGFEQPMSLKMEAPRFNGSDAASWISRVQYYFDHLMFPDDYRLHYVVMLFDPPVAEWIFNYRANNPHAIWSNFLEDVRRRFDPKCFVNYFGLIAKLCQTGSLADYNKEFEGMLNRVHGVPDYMLLTLYVEGLQQPVHNQVKFQYPPSMAAAIALALEFDAAIERPPQTSNFQRRAWQPRDNRHQNSQPAGLQATSQPPHRTGQPHTKNSDFSGLPVIRLSAAEKAERSKKGMCWYCPEKWIPGHVCRKTFLSYMGVEDEGVDEQECEEEQLQTEIITVDLSHIYALEGQPRSDSLKLVGKIGMEEVLILVDTESSHDFLHPRIAEKLKLPLTAVRPFQVYVGNGESLLCSYASIATQLQIQDEVFTVTLHILPIHGSDVILEMSWLRSLRRVTNDYEGGTIEFMKEDVPVCLRVLPPKPREVSICRFATLLLHRGESQLFELLSVGDQPSSPEDPPSFPKNLPAPVMATLEAHLLVFQIPVGMPPPRAFDHRIHLLPNTKPINVRPYRYPYFQKTEIERQVKEMLDTGIIRPSHNPFSSPVLLIRKKDGSFRFCIDYRALNTATVPDHFPIPTTDELFDELGAARFFTKLDLRAGYHQIRKHTANIFKTAFRTHDGHFEFLVMPFGLTNAPSTFQAAMNDIFRPLLRKSVIVFFDDILIYNPTMETHAQHLYEVLSILASHSFFVKLSKCIFCSSTVDYLGHFIAGGQLKADPSKIEAMVAWPIPATIKQLRGFLGLTGYYRQFIAGYASIAAPLTALLKKDAFCWTEEAEISFAALKEAITSAPVLRLPGNRRLKLWDRRSAASGWPSSGLLQ